MSKRLASLFLAYGLVAALVAPAAPIAQEEAPAPAPSSPAEPAPEPAAPEHQSPAPAQRQASEEPAPAPAPAPAQPAPAAPTPEPAPSPKAAADPEPVAVKAAPGGVTIRDFSFAPGTVTVNVGETVTWTNSGPTGHSATADDGSFDTGTLSKGRSGSHRFTEAGTFSYHCTPHPNMTATVRVQAASDGGDDSAGDGAGADDSAGGGTTTDTDPGSSAGSTSSESLPNSGVDAGGLAIVGLGFLLLGLFARRRTAA